MKVLNASSIATRVQRVEVVNVDVLPAVISFPGPELRIRLALQDVASLYESFAQAELVVPDSSQEVRITGGIGGIGLEHHLRPHPCFVAVVVRVQPVVDKDELAVRFRFVAQAVFGIRAGSLECYLLPTLAIEAITRTEIAVELEALHLLL